MTKLTFSGGPALEAALKELGSQVAGRLGENAVRAGARVIATRARQKAPRDTGALKQSIRAFQDTERRAGERTAYAGSRLFYARFIEFGTRFIPARSFLRGALDESGQVGDGITQDEPPIGGRLRRRGAGSESDRR